MVLSMIVSNSLISYSSALPEAKIMVPSICELHPQRCQILPNLNDPSTTNDQEWQSPTIPHLKTTESLIVVPVNNGVAVLAIKVPTQAIDISKNFTSPVQ